MADGVAVRASADEGRTARTKGARGSRVVPPRLHRGASLRSRLAGEGFGGAVRFAAVWRGAGRRRFLI